MTTVASSPRILVADDQPDLVEALRLLLKPHGFQMEAVSSPDEAVRAVRRGGFDLMLMDLNYTSCTTSGREGLDLLSRVRALDGALPIFVMTGWGSLDVAIEAMRYGVRDFVQKPWDGASLLARLKAEIERARDSHRELDEAVRIQRTLMPATLPRLEGFELAASWQPAGRVGGDCYDAIPFGRSRLAITIADVVGKGVPAALLMSGLQASVRAFASDQIPPDELCARVNRIITSQVAAGRFISFFYCLLDASTGVVWYSNAGHYPALLVRADGAVEKLSAGGPVLGAIPTATFDRDEVEMRPGDRLVLYTDGITEARDGGDEEFGEERLIQELVAHRSCSAPALQARVVDAVSAFTGGVFQDDATLLVVAAQP
jgi:sigma-B regulation protein RsbU (phosphoserine phosphatase)